ncbi:MAG: hypothetical protein GC181_16385 [Bacteroidetes bacterium]|nr:hypothetical protein [Bacteroidota bacterium]
MKKLISLFYVFVLFVTSQASPDTSRFLKTCQYLGPQFVRHSFEKDNSTFLPLGLRYQIYSGITGRLGMRTGLGICYDQWKSTATRTDIMLPGSLPPGSGNIQDLMIDYSSELTLAFYRKKDYELSQFTGLGVRAIKSWMYQREMETLSKQFVKNQQVIAGVNAGIMFRNLRPEGWYYLSISKTLFLPFYMKSSSIDFTAGFTF